MEVVLRAVMGNDRLRVTEIITQQSVPNLYGRSVRFDALATDGENIYDVEIQRSDEGAIPRRARYNSSMIDSREVSKGTLLHDFFCSDPNDMYSDVLAERVRFFKEDEKGVAAMCKIMEEIHNDGISIGEIRGAETERLKNIKSLIQRMGVTAEVAMDALNIAKDDQPKYLTLL